MLDDLSTAREEPNTYKEAEISPVRDVGLNLNRGAAIPSIEAEVMIGAGAVEEDANRT